MRPKEAASRPTGEGLENEVARIYDLLGADTTTRVLIKGYEVDVQAVVPMGPMQLRILVECKEYAPERRVSDPDMRSFVVKVLAARESGAADKGVFVTTSGYSKDAVATASRHGIDCLTLGDLHNQLVDFSPYIQSSREAFDASPIARWYVPQTGSEIEDYDSLLSPGEASPYLHRPLLDHVDSLIQGGERRVALLGNFGTGKSSFCAKYADVLIKRHLDDPRARIPVVIQLRDYRSGLDIQDLIVATLGRNFGVRIDSRLCSELQRMGRFIFLLDGLDEMATKVDRAVVNENLREFDRLHRDGANHYVVTCRTHFFQERVSDEFLKGYSTIYLVEWGLEDLRAYLKLRFPEEWRRYFDRISASPRLRDITKTPQFVEMLIEGLSESDLKRAGELASSGLYAKYVEKWIESESARRGAVMSAKQRREFVESLAGKLFVDQRSSIHYTELYELAREFSGYGDPTRLDYFDTDARTCSFITKDSAGNYGFRHRSFMEYFAARVAVDELLGGSPSVLRSRELSPEILAFVSEMQVEEANYEQLHEWSGLHTSSDTIDQVLSRNSVSMLTAYRQSLRKPVAEAYGVAADDDWALLRRAFVEDDSDQFSTAIEKLYPRLLQFAKRHLARSGEDYDADDIVQEVLVRIWQRDRNRHDLFSDVNFERYIFSMMRHAAIDRSRLRSRNMPLPIDALDESLATGITPDDDAVDARDFLKQVMSKLSTREQAVLQSYIDGESTTELSQRLRVAVGSARSLRYRVLSKIRKMYRDER